jgi:hypothetical protein
MTDFQRFIKARPEYREEAEERAAIMEFDGGFDRETAERMALWRLYDKYGRKQK